MLDCEIALRTGDTGRARARCRRRAAARPGRSLLMLSGVRLAEGDFKGALEAAGPVLDGRPTR